MYISYLFDYIIYYIVIQRYFSENGKETTVLPDSVLFDKTNDKIIGISKRTRCS